MSIDRDKLDEFTRGYIEAALWSSSACITWSDEANAFIEAPDDDTSFESHNFDIDDIDEESLESMVKDCAEFQAQNERLLEIASRMCHRGEDAHGHDFWLNRNHHGAGFWDRGYRFGIGDALSDAAHSFGSSDLYFGDDQRIHCA